MDFVIQYNLFSEDNLVKVKEAVANLPHQFVGLIPFSREITSNEPIIGLDHIPYGSTSFVETTYELDWKGLSFDPKKFSYDIACNNRDDMLNRGRILPVRKAIDFLKRIYADSDWSHTFIRPAHDLKQFAGAVYPVKEAIEFLTDATETTSSGSYKIEDGTLIVVSYTKKILIEWRWFIVGGEVTDGSMYRRNGQLIKEHLDYPDLQMQAQTLADKWLPNPCCVMDLALLDSGDIKVVEFNCINGSGFYHHDIKKIMTTWSKHFNQ